MKIARKQLDVLAGCRIIPIKYPIEQFNQIKNYLESIPSFSFMLFFLKNFPKKNLHASCYKKSDIIVEVVVHP